MRKISCVIGAFFLIAGAFAKGGVMSGAGKLSVIRTEHFDIIFPPESEPAAAKIEAVAEHDYHELCSLFDVLPEQHFSVAITHSVESLNAYFTAVPYNAIVMYDTLPDPSLDQNTDWLTAVFYHELTHAVATNIRSPFARFLSGLFGSWFAPAGFTQTRFMHEGTAVSFESLSGEGRVHDPFSAQIVVQAKADGRFPSWRDVTGARDTFPGGTDAYAFGAAFCHYLQETYGWEKFTTFWKTAGNIHGFKRSFKKTYGESISAAWKSFEAWVPAVTLAPAIDFTAFQHKKSVFTHLDSAGSLVVWYDSQTGSVWCANTAQSEKPKKLFSCASVTRLSLSDDGRYLAVSYRYASHTVRTGICIYTFATKKLVTLPFASVRDAGFIRETDGTLRLMAVDIAQSQQSSLVVYTIGEQKSDFWLVRRIPFSADEIPFNPVAANQGGFACIVKKGMDWRIRVYDDDAHYRAYGAEHTVLHNLHRFSADAETLSFTFSYARTGTFGGDLPHAGMLVVTEHGTTSELVLQTDIVSGGVLDAVRLPSSTGERLAYIGAFYDNQRLLELDMTQVAHIRHAGDAPPRTLHHAPSVSAEVPVGTRFAYQPFRYYRHGMLIPVGLVSAYQRDSLDTFSFGYTNPGTAFVGATLASANPWLDTVVALSGGWNPFDKNGGVSLDVSGGSDIVSYDANGAAIFDGLGFMQTTAGLSFSAVLFSRFARTLSVGATGVSLYGRDSADDETDFSYRADGYIRFSTVHKVFPGYFQYGGISVQPFVFSERVHASSAHAGLSFGARIPGIVPLTLTATLFPSSSYVATASLSGVLFSWETQKGIPALYVDRVYVRAAYVARLSYDAASWFAVAHTARILADTTKDDYSDIARLEIRMIAAVNAGLLARLGFDAGVVLQYFPHAGADEKKMSAGVNLHLAY